MKSSMRRRSLVVTMLSTSNLCGSSVPSGIMPAILAGRSETSKCSMARSPETPLVRRSQLALWPMPSGVTMPRPVTTTRLMRSLDSALSKKRRRAARAAARRPYRLRMRLDEVDRILDGQDLLGGIVGNLTTEFFFEGHDQFHRVEAVRPQIIDEARRLGHLGLFDTQMLDNDLLNAFGDVRHLITSYWTWFKLVSP